MTKRKPDKWKLKNNSYDLILVDYEYHFFYVILYRKILQNLS